MRTWYYCLFLFFLVISCSTEKPVKNSALDQIKTTNILSKKHHVTAQIQLSSQKIDFTDVLNVDVTLQHPTSVVAGKLRLPKWVYHEFEEIAAPLFSKKQFKLAGEETIIQRATYFFRPKVIGKTHLQSFFILYRLLIEKPNSATKKWKTYTLTTSTILVIVQSKYISLKTNLAQTQKSFPPTINWVLILGVSGGLLLLGGANLLFWKTRNDPVLISNKQTSRTPQQKAQFQWNELKTKQYLESHETRKWYLGSSQILRKILYNHFNFSNSLTQNLPQQIHQSNYFTQPQKELLQNFFQQTELVKFASFLPNEDITQSFAILIAEIVENINYSYQKK